MFFSIEGWIGDSCNIDLSRNNNRQALWRKIKKVFIILFEASTINIECNDVDVIIYVIATNNRELMFLI